MNWKEKLAYTHIYLFMNVHSSDFKRIISSYRLQKHTAQKGYIGYKFLTILSMYNLIAFCVILKISYACFRFKP